MGLLDSLLGDGRKFIKRKDSDEGETVLFFSSDFLSSFHCSFVLVLVFLATKEGFGFGCCQI